ncbi:MAG: septum formation initiator family protein [Eubacteriales bacterium]
MRRRHTRKKNNNKASMGLVLLVLFMIWVVVGYNSILLNETKQAYEKQEEDLLLQLEEENARTLEIEEYEKYTQTMKFVEEVAKDKLGLVYDGEIIFKEAQ